MARRLSRFERSKRWLRCHKMHVALLLLLLVNSFTLGPALSKAFGKDSTGNYRPANHAPEKGAANAMKGAMAFYDDTTTACMVSKRYFFYMAVGEKMSSASAVVQDNKENACFEGPTGAMTIVMREALVLSSMQFQFRKYFNSFWPRDIIVYGSENQGEMEELARIRINKHSTDQHFHLKGHKTPIKSLKIVVVDNWGGNKTVIQNISVRGAGA